MAAMARKVGEDAGLREFDLSTLNIGSADRQPLKI